MDDQNDTSDQPADDGQGGPVEASTATVEAPQPTVTARRSSASSPSPVARSLGASGFPSPDEPARDPEELEEA